MRQAKLSRPVGACSVSLLLCAALASPVRAQLIYQDELVDGLPGPDALYDPDQGQPQSLLAEPRNVLFPGLGLPFEAERLAFRQRLYDQYGLTYALSYQQLTQYATQTYPACGRIGRLVAGPLLARPGRPSIGGATTRARW